MNRPGPIQLDDLVIDVEQLRHLVGVLIGSVVVRPDGLTFQVCRDGHDLLLLPVDLTALRDQRPLN